MSILKFVKRSNPKSRAYKRSHEDDSILPEELQNKSDESPVSPNEDEARKTKVSKTTRFPFKEIRKEWRKIQRENLDIDYTVLYTEREARSLFEKCESELVYNVGHLAKVRLFGKWMDIPRKQVAHGDAGLSYTFSGNTIPARPWSPLLLELRDHVFQASGYSFNFVLINRYENGADYMGEHKDDEKDLCPDHPIASLSLGQERDFIFKHQDCRGKDAKRRIDTVSISLENGSLLMMNSPTNRYWYHSLPKRTKARGARINFTFRKMVPSNCRPVHELPGKSEESPA